MRRRAGAAGAASFVAGLALIASVAAAESFDPPRVAREACPRCGGWGAAPLDRAVANRWLDAAPADGTASASSQRWTRARMFWRTASDLAYVTAPRWASRVVFRG